MSRIKKCALLTTTIIVILSIFAGCTKPATDAPVNDVDFTIEEINIENLVNFTGRLSYETAVDTVYTGDRVTLYGEKMFVDITFSDDITSEPRSTTLNQQVDEKLDNLLKQANPELELKTWVLDSNQLRVAIIESVEATEEQDYDIVIPAELTNLTGKTLKESEIVRLHMDPHTFVKAISKSTVSPLHFDGVYNTYSCNLEPGSNYYISLQFNNEVDQDTAMAKVQEAFDPYNGSYSWINSKELKISLTNIRADINARIELSEVLDVDGNRIYTSPVISILVGK